MFWEDWALGSALCSKVRSFRLQALYAMLSWPLIDTLGQASLKMAVHAREWKAARALAVLGWDVDSAVGGVAPRHGMFG